MLSDKNKLAVATSIAPAGARTTSTNGSSVDLQSVNKALVAFVPAAITDGTHTPKLQESSDNSTFTDVAAGDQDGTLAALAANTIQTVAYIGTKRYIRAVITVTGSPATGGIYGAVVITNSREKQP